MASDRKRVVQEEVGKLERGLKMEILLVGFIIIIIGLAVLAKKKKEVTQESNSKYLKKQPLSTPEQVMFHKLKLCLPNHIILAQVAFSQMLKVKGGTKKENDSKFSRAKQKVADFVICDKAFNIIATIEIDDKSHKKDKDEARDQMLLEAGIPTIRWKAVNLPNDEEIKQKIDAAVQTESAAINIDSPSIQNRKEPFIAS